MLLAAKTDEAYARRSPHIGQSGELRVTLSIAFRSHAVHSFLCVFVAYSNKILLRSKKCFFFSRSYTISSIYIRVVGNTPYGRRHISRTKAVYGKLSKIKGYIHPSHFVQVPNQFDAFFNSKNAPEKNTRISLRHLLVNLKKYELWHHQFCVALNLSDNGNHLYSHLFTPPMEPCVPKTTSAAT